MHVPVRWSVGNNPDNTTETAMSKHVFFRLGLFTALSLPLVAASAGEIDRTGLSKSVDELAATYFQNENPGCAVGVIYRGEYIHKSGYGMSNLEHNIPITSKSVFRIGSTSKQFTAMAIAILAERGQLDLDADVHTYLPELMDYGHNVTIRQMVHHIAGMGDYDHEVFNKPDGSPFRFGNEDFWSIEDFYAVAAKASLVHPPESKWQYSNLAYFLLSMVVEKVSGKTLNEFAEKELFEKLNMPATLFNDNVNRVIPNRADGYKKSENGSYEIFMTNLSWVGDGGIYTNLDDFIAWDQNFYHNRLGKGVQDLIDLVEKPHAEAYFGGGGSERPNDDTENSPEKPVSGYAFGLVVDHYLGERRIAHNGGWVGFISIYQRFPDLSLSVVSFCNTPAKSISEFWDKVVDIYVIAVKKSNEKVKASRESQDEL
jgi:CubicO group peptidase (beta-lactamase class C family)